MMRTIYIAVCICLAILTCGQNAQPDTPEDFFARFKDVVESKDAHRFQSEILVSKSEFREFMKDNCGMHFDFENPSPEVDAQLYKMVEETWPFTLRDGLTQFQENAFEVYFEKFKLDSIQSDSSPLAIGTALGRVPFVKHLAISAHFQHLEDSTIQHQVRFRCVKIYDDKWKMWSTIDITTSEQKYPPPVHSN